MRFYLPLIAALLLAGTTACSTGASYEERIAYLQTTSGRGAQTHDLLVSQGAPKIDLQRCTDAYNALRDRSAPSDTPAAPTPEWNGQIQAFFVDSCVSGLPRPVDPQDAPGTPATPPQAPAAPTP